MRVVDVLTGRACVLSDIFWQHWNNGVAVGKGEGEARANRPLRAAVRSVPFIKELSRSWLVLPGYCTYQCSIVYAND